MSTQKNPLTIELDVEDQEEAKLVYAALRFAAQNSSRSMNSADLERLAQQVQQQCIEHFER